MFNTLDSLVRERMARGVSTIDRRQLGMFGRAMNNTRSGNANRQKTLNDRRKPLVNIVTVLFSAPLLFIYFISYTQPIMLWLRANGVLPEYGVAQFLDGRSAIDWDEVMVSGVVGMLVTLTGSLLGGFIARLIIR